MLKLVAGVSLALVLAGCATTSTPKADVQTTQQTTAADIVTSVTTPEGGIKYVLKQDDVSQDIIVYAGEGDKVEKVRTVQYVDYPSGLTKQTKQGFITVMKARWEDGKSESVKKFKEQGLIKGVTPYMDFSETNQIMGVDIVVADIDKQATVEGETGLASLLKILATEPTVTDFELILVRSGAQRQE